MDYITPTVPRVLRIKSPSSPRMVPSFSPLEAILSAIRDGGKAHTAEQVDGIYVLRQDMSVPTSSHLCAKDEYLEFNGYVKDR